MSARLAGKKALITAAGAGIGRATALAFAGAGANVLATDIDADALTRLAAEHPSISTRLLDVTDAAAIGALVAAVDTIDVLFNCAGYVHAGTILETDEAGWRRSFAINVDGMFHLCKAVLPGMLARGSGSIVNMSSVAGFVGSPMLAGYCATKGGVRLFTKACALEFAQLGYRIRVNSVHPGFIWTPMVENYLKQSGDLEVGKNALNDLHPLGHVGDVDDIAYGVLYLASDESKFTTGTELVIDGGYTAR